VNAFTLTRSSATLNATTPNGLGGSAARARTFLSPGNRKRLLIK
jgi:hypothetical protein